jgi:RNA polymerase-interacting CarD/CdnL/TRCF family regulator
VEAAYGKRSSSSSQIFRIIKQARAGKNTDNQWHLNLEKTVRTANLIASVAAVVADYWRIDTRSLAAAHGVCLRTICRILKEDLGLVKKLAH